MRHYSIRNPHPPEIPAFQRGPLNFFVTIPPGGVTPETVPVLVLHGHGGSGAENYLESLHASLTSRQNVMVITVDYLGTQIVRGNLKPDINEWCLARINKSYQRRGLPPFPFDIRDKKTLEKNLFPYLKTLPARFNQMNDPLVYFVGIAEGEHYDFGLVQTLDCLWAIRALQDEYPSADWASLSAVGVSHGGYLSAMCAKFAPRTFALIVNSYGWAKPDLHWMLKELQPMPHQVEGIHTVYFAESYWTRDPKSPFHLSEDRILIRTQNDPGQLAQWRRHQEGSPTHYVFTQQVDDALHSAAEKDELVERMRALGFSLEYYKKSDPASGIQYRSLDQGDKTSLKGLFFDFVTPDRIRAHRVVESDFKLKSRIAYRCKENTYEIDYSRGMPTYTVRPNQPAQPSMEAV